MKYCRRLRFMSETEKNLIDMADQGLVPAEEVKISPESVERMNDYMIDEINRVVGSDDTLVHGGDVFWGHNQSRDFPRMKSLRDRINCKNLVLIWGNHDEPWIAPLFQEVYDQKMFVVSRQKIVVCHYPMRAWDQSHRMSWMLYGHVHGALFQQDLEGMSTAHKADTISVYAELLNDVMSDDYAWAEAKAAKLLDAYVHRNCGIDLTVDIGVDSHDYRPWSMEELQAWFAPRMARWRERKHRQDTRLPVVSWSLKAKE